MFRQSRVPLLLQTAIVVIGFDLGEGFIGQSQEPDRALARSNRPGARLAGPDRALPSTPARQRRAS